MHFIKLLQTFWSNITIEMCKMSSSFNTIVNKKGNINLKTGPFYSPAEKFPKFSLFAVRPLPILSYNFLFWGRTFGCPATLFFSSGAPEPFLVGFHSYRHDCYGDTIVPARHGADHTKLVLTSQQILNRFNFILYFFYTFLCFKKWKVLNMRVHFLEYHYFTQLT
jgi:hypothetical protein